MRSDILSGILSVTYFGFLSRDICSDHLSGNLFGISSGINSDNLSGNLFGISSGVLHVLSGILSGGAHRGDGVGEERRRGGEGDEGDRSGMVWIIR